MGYTSTCNSGADFIQILAKRVSAVHQLVFRMQIHTKRSQADMWLSRLY
jgi:hypothetical protein